MFPFVNSRSNSCHCWIREGHSGTLEFVSIKSFLFKDKVLLLLNISNYYNFSFFIMLILTVLDCGGEH
ncbi:hypothetical protein CQ056_17835 [Peribacillus simplex]|nr:hypothetical protein CQ056_17835 [Peribacillus simplex]